MKPRFAILLDGGFVTKSLQKRKGQFPAATDVMQETARVTARPELAGQDLLRVYFYDAPPATAALKNPIDGSNLHLGSGNVFQRGKALLEALELQADFAVRRGETVVRGWKLGAAAQKNLIQNPRALQASDLVPRRSLKRTRFCSCGMSQAMHSVAAAFGADNCGHHRRQRLDSCLQICTARGDPRLSRSHGVAGSPRTTSSYEHCVLIHEIPTARNRARSGFLADGRESRGANNLSVNALRYDPAIPGDGGSMR
jgi:hypothetical protein